MMDWRHRAACRTEDPELFFPVGNTGPALLQITKAKAVCFRCPVASACLSWALDNRQDAGVWGGMSEDERRALTRRRTALSRIQNATEGESDADGSADPVRPGSAELPVDVELCIAGRLEKPGRDVLLLAMRHLLALGWTRTKVSQTLHINGTLTKELAEQVEAEKMTEQSDLITSAL
jgi:WhiB family redox-sensing transcriptional regulator